MRVSAAVILVVVLVVLLVGALVTPAKEVARPAARSEAAKPAAATYKDVLIEGVPHVKQRPDFCGEACAEMVLKKLGHKINQNDVFNESGLDPLLGRGCFTKELATALKRIGFKVGPVYGKVEAAKAGVQMEAQWRELHEDLLKGVPSILCMHYSDKPKTTEHFRLVLGYDGKTDEVIYHEPAEAGGAYRRMKRERLMKLWPLKYQPKRWTVIRLRLEAGEIKKINPAATFTDADYAQHIRSIKEKMPKTGFHVVIQPPFVVVGDESAARVRERAESTVRWSVVRLKKQYFPKDPDEILTIWLFKDKASYRKHTREIFSDNPTTPFGYYSHTHRALIMNIATGGGTLVHEIVHPFMRANFPACPAWLNEGMGSLYEQSSSRSGRIVGLTNWRLAGLQKAIKAGRVPSFKELTSTTERQFYNEDSGSNYAQARYLCYYLQEKDLLEKFYHQFHAAAKGDPSGYKTLQKVLGEKDMAAFKKTWEAWVLKLHFP